MPDKRRPRILYLMHVDWKWIKQRPHLLAENLSGFFDVDVFYGRTFHKKKNVIPNSNPKGLRLTPIVRLPMVLNKFRLLRTAAAIINRLVIGNIASKYDIVWFCHPVFYDDVKHLLKPGVKVVYDCMDDILEFPTVKRDQILGNYLKGLETDLVRRADVVFCSAVKLMNRMRKDYHAKNLYLVNNGIQLSAFAKTTDKTGVAVNEYFNDDGVHVTYIGTVAEWMDFRLVLESVKRFDNIRYHFFGPVNPGLPLPEHPRITFHGPVPHDRVNPLMKHSGLLVMPFIVNELILSVDPVKLYEYIGSGRPTLAVRYPETVKFGPYAHLYGNSKEYMNIIKQASERRLKPKKNTKACVAFTKKNTWDVRAKTVAGILHKLLK